MLFANWTSTSKLEAYRKQRISIVMIITIRENIIEILLWYISMHKYDIKWVGIDRLIIDYFVNKKPKNNQGHY